MTLLIDIQNTTEAREEEMTELTRQQTGRNDTNLAGLAAVRDLAMVQQATSFSSDVVHLVGDGSERPQRTPHRSYCESLHNMFDAIETLKKGEERKSQLFD